MSSIYCILASLSTEHKLTDFIANPCFYTVYLKFCWYYPFLTWLHQYQYASGNHMQCDSFTESRRRI